jgi:hypothetical protein
MFDRLMSMLNRGGTITIDQMARELDTSPELVAQLIDHLANAGRLRPMGMSCDSACTHCAFVRDCGRAGESRVWQVGGE